MAKKPTTPKKSVSTSGKSALPAPAPAAAPVSRIIPSEAPVVTAVRNSPVPKAVTPAAPAKKEVSFEMIAKRAYEISQSSRAGDQTHNWLLAERELRGV